MTMSPSLLLLNPHLTDKMLAGAGMLAGLGARDIRELSQARVPVWAVVGGSLVLGFAAALLAVRAVPDSWSKALLAKKPTA